MTIRRPSHDAAAVKSEPLKLPANRRTRVPARFLIALMAFSGITLNYILRVNINFAVVAMVKHSPANASAAAVNHTASDSGEDFLFLNGSARMGLYNATEADGGLAVLVAQEQEKDATSAELDKCPAPKEHTESHATYDGDLPWSEWTQGLVVGAFYYGNVCTQVGGGRLAEVWGSRRVMGVAMLASALLTLLQPVAARASYIFLIFVRILIGLFLGVTTPATQTLLAGWAPPMERSTISSFVYAGAPAGTIVAFPVSAFIIETMGWEAVFYLQGTLALLWCIGWYYIVTDSPKDFHWISDDEKEYITSSIGISKNKKTPPTPIKHMVTSLPVWSVIISAVGNNWGFYTLLTIVPQYMKTIMHKDIKTNAMLSGLPYVGMWAWSLAAGVAGDWLMRRRNVRTVVVRKTANTIANVGPALCLMGLLFVKCDWWATVALMSLAVTAVGAIYSGHYVNPIDLAPNFAGTMSGIVNTVGNVPGFLAPLAAGYITDKQSTLTQYRKVFIIAAVVYIVDAIVYLLFASGEEQSWNSMPEAADPESGDAPETTQQKGGSGDSFKESGVLRGVFVQSDHREDIVSQQKESHEGKGAPRGSRKAVLQSKPSGDDAGHTNKAYCSTEGE
ncbi:sialin-like [Penaeus indicus]|uniref:sialin-like n=1 Tax=Penaeus indicus TaxID=29960 RepID=UPI00300DB358